MGRSVDVCCQTEPWATFHRLLRYPLLHYPHPKTRPKWGLIKAHLHLVLGWGWYRRGTLEVDEYLLSPKLPFGSSRGSQIREASHMDSKHRREFNEDAVTAWRDSLALFGDVHVYLCIFSHVYISTYVYMYVYVGVSVVDLSVHTCIHIYICIHIGTYIRMHTHIYIYVCIYIYTSLALCKYKCVYRLHVCVWGS